MSVYQGDPILRVEVEKIDNTQVKLHIEVAVEDVNSALEDAYKILRGYVSLPGFRKGKAPLSIIKSRFPDYINTEVVNQLVSPAYEEALYLKDLMPLAQPIFEPPLDQLKVTENTPFTFNVLVKVKPSFEIPEYEEIETDKTPINVPRENVEKHIQKLQWQSATFEPIQEIRHVQDTDCVRLDWTCTVDGQELQDESLHDIDIDLTSEHLTEDLKSGIIGMNIGETKVIEVNYDSSYEIPELAGKQAIYDVTLHAITIKHLPDLDDEFAKDLGYETYNQMHGVIWNTLVEEERILQTEKQKGEILDQLIDKTNITIPDDLVDEYIQKSIENMQKQMKAQNQTPELLGIDMDSLPTDMRPNVIRQTKQNWIFEEIADTEGIYVTDDELEWELRRAADQQNRDAQKYADLLKESNRLEDFRIQLQHEKIYQFLIDNSSAKKSLIIAG